jgi:hypothetical protein
MVHHFIQGSHKAVEILFVQEYFMAFVAITVFPAGAFCNGDEKVISFGFFHIKEISASFSSSYAFGKHTFFLFAVTVVATTTVETAAAAIEAPAITAAATIETAAITAAAIKTATVATATAETVVALPETTPITSFVALVATAITSFVALVAATVAVAITKVVISPFKMPEFHLSNSFMKRMCEKM